MLLAVDIGNSAIKFGVFDGPHLTSKFSIPTNSDLHSAELIEKVGNATISKALVCSVVPGVNSQLSDALEAAFDIDVRFVTNYMDFGLDIKYEPLGAAGTDRLVNAFAAAEKYGVPVIACSFGTATTIDVVDKNRVLRGGLIAPGMKTMAKALHLNTAQLPEIEIDAASRVINHTTETSIQAGIFYSQIGLVESTVARIKKEIGDNPKVIATGGFASMIAENTDVIDVVDENLLLDGLRILAE
ncbi:MAG TPA: type III pantothenate kinase [Pyrinomonadaceae bacterium]|nr:type III pantothenate kinase [Pyrinomonadaceae bacterium]